MSSPAFPGRLTPGDPDLTERQRAVFIALVTLHGRSADPISSERIAHHAGIGLSAASVRATLAELEHLGLLERAHASSGRAPSTAGYAFFVRALLAPAPLPEWAQREIDVRLSRSHEDVERLLQDASRLLASLTRQLGLALAVSLEHELLADLEIEPIAARRALLSLTFVGGAARSLVLELESDLGARDLAQVEDVLRQQLLRRSLGEMRRRLAEDAGLVRDAAVRVVAQAALRGWSRVPSTPLLSAGAAFIADQPEFARGRALAPMLDALEQGSPLDRLLVRGVQGRAGVQVGMPGEAVFARCSLVSFPLPGRVPGAVGVLGPQRMDYAHALAAVERVGMRVADLLAQ